MLPGGQVLRVVIENYDRYFRTVIEFFVTILK